MIISLRVKNSITYIFALPHGVSRGIIRKLNILMFQMSDWDRFASEEYELLVAEEGNAEGMDEL